MLNQGVGYRLYKKLRDLELETCQDLRKISLSALQKDFGAKTGQMLYHYCRGIDERPVQAEHERKSVSAEINYGIRFTEVWNNVSIRNYFLYRIYRCKNVQNLAFNNSFLFS